jgi:hypothetical protein
MDLHTGLLAACRDTAGAWRFIQNFAAHHTTPIETGDGYDETTLTAAEARLGIPLPGALRAAYALFGRRADLTDGQDWLLPPDHLHLDGGVLVFRRENQSVTDWGVPAAAGEPDPPVVVRDPDPAAGGPAWAPWMDRVSLAFVEIVLSEWILAAERDSPGQGDNRDLDEREAALVAQRFRRLPLPEYPLWPEPAGPPVRWYDRPGVVLRVDAGNWVWARAESRRRMRELREALPGDWLLD